MKFLLPFACVGCLFFLLAVPGCAPPEAETGEVKAAATEDAHAGHHHDHGDLGPHGGHLLHLEPTGVHAEWAHDDENHLITVFLDDFAADSIKEAKFTVTIEGETEEFELESGGDGWTVTSEALMTHINMGEAAEVKFVVVDDKGESFTKIEAHEHHHH